MNFMKEDNKKYLTTYQVDQVNHIMFLNFCRKVRLNKTKNLYIMQNRILLTLFFGADTAGFF